MLLILIGTTLIGLGVQLQTLHQMGHVNGDLIKVVLKANGGITARVILGNIGGIDRGSVRRFGITSKASSRTASCYFKSMRRCSSGTPSNPTSCGPCNDWAYPCCFDNGICKKRPKIFTKKNE